MERLLASETGWSRAEIRAMPYREFRFHIDDLINDGTDEE